MSWNQPQSRRFEQRYLITEATAQRMRKLVGNYLERDGFGTNQPDLSYPVRTLSLNSAATDIYWPPDGAPKNRYELRLRRYSDNLDSPVFVEVKRQVNCSVLKQRTRITQSALPRLMAGSPMSPEDLSGYDPKGLVRIEAFRSLNSKQTAPSGIQINFDREAYVSDREMVRVTMDRHTCWEPNRLPRFKTRLNNPVCSLKGLVILELKFVDRFPDWLREVAHLADGDTTPKNENC